MINVYLIYSIKDCDIQDHMRWNGPGQHKTISLVHCMDILPPWNIPQVSHGAHLPYTSTLTAPLTSYTLAPAGKGLERQNIMGDFHQY